MPTEGIEIVFESNIPVIGQVTILEAVDFLYSAIVLGTDGWRTDAPSVPNWLNRIVSLPGKFIKEEHFLIVESAHSDSPVTEVVIGTAAAVLTFISTLLESHRRKKKNEFTLAQSKIAFVTEQLQPAIRALQKAGASADQVKALVQKSATYLDDLLTELISKEKLQIRRR